MARARFVSLAVVAAIASCAAHVSAQDPQPTVYVAQPPPPMVLDAPRFRFGISGALGGERINDDRTPLSFSAWLVGMDLRFGLQLNDLIGVYVPIHFSGGSGGYEGGGTGSTGTFTAMGMIDFTLFDQLQFGAGFGYGVLNNPKGPALGLRVAGLPIMGRSTFDNRRRGLVLAFDLRVIFSEVGTGVQYMGSVGYEAF